MVHKPKRNEFGFKISNRGAPEKWTPGRVDELAEEFMTYLKECYEADETPFINQFSIISGFDSDMCPQFCVMSPEFKSAHKLAKSMQELQLCRFGLNRKNDSKFSQWMLACNHGWKTHEQKDKEEELKNSFEEYITFVKRFNAESPVAETNPST